VRVCTGSAEAFLRTAERNRWQGCRRAASNQGFPTTPRRASAGSSRLDEGKSRQGLLRFTRGPRGRECPTTVRRGAGPIAPGKLASFAPLGPSFSGGLFFAPPGPLSGRRPRAVPRLTSVAIARSSKSRFQTRLPHNGLRERKRALAVIRAVNRPLPFGNGKSA